uniref:Protoheme IX farnesyltransferase, mitochondrial n=1 Tax=Anthurium amnicola TaxID=1678845 RepID=A0A1D1YFW3_9ARAE
MGTPSDRAPGMTTDEQPTNQTVRDEDTAGYIEKYNRYQAEYARRLKAKYFSKKAFNGGNIFDQETNIDGETIKSSRCHCTRSFADPVHGVQESGNLPFSASETSLSSRKHNLKKSS